MPQSPVPVFEAVDEISAETSVVVILKTAETGFGPRAAALDVELSGILSRACSDADALAESGTCIDVIAPQAVSTRRVIVLALGKAEAVSALSLARAGGLLAAHLEGKASARLPWFWTRSSASTCRARTSWRAWRSACGCGAIASTCATNAREQARIEPCGCNWSAQAARNSPRRWRGSTPLPTASNMRARWSTCRRTISTPTISTITWSRCAKPASTSRSSIRPSSGNSA